MTPCPVLEHTKRIIYRREKALYLIKYYVASLNGTREASLLLVKTDPLKHGLAEFAAKGWKTDCFTLIFHCRFFKKIVLC